MRLTETSGRTPITLTSLGVAFGNIPTVTAPLESTRLNAGASERLSGITFASPTSLPTPVSTMAITIGFRDDNTRTGSATASTDVEQLALVTLNGRVTDRSTGSPIANANVRVQSIGPNESKSVRTDVNGVYALTPLVAGAFSVFYEASGYVGQSHPINIATDATWNVALERTPPPVLYEITGSARTCDVTYRSSAGGTSQRNVTIPWSFERTASAGDFLYVSCQINQSSDRGSIFVRIYRQGRLVDSASATGFPNIATASGSF